MQTALPATTTVAMRSTSIGPGSTGYQAVSAMPAHPVARLTQELRRSRGRVGGGEQIGVGKGGTLEARIVEERVDPPRPGRGVQVRLGVMAVAGRAAVRRPPAGAVVAHVDRRVEVLGPDAHDRDVVAGPGLGPEPLQRLGREL